MYINIIYSVPVPISAINCKDRIVLSIATMESLKKSMQAYVQMW